MRFIPRISVVVLVMASALMLASTASATITHTHITTPAKSPAYFAYNYNHPNTFTVAGKTDSTSPTTDTVDILCFYGDDGRFYRVATDVPLRSDGSFSTAAPLNTVYASECHLAALPSGEITLESAFTGPRIEVNERRVYPIGTTSKPYDYYVWAQQTPLADDYDSVGSCGLCDSYLFDEAGGNTAIVFYANAWLNYENENGSGDTRSEIKVDGRNAYTSGAAEPAFSGSDTNSGFPALTWKYSQDPVSGDVTITETDVIARCRGSHNYPPSSTNCPSFKPTGVEVRRKLVQSASGHVVSITDNYESTDGHTHKLDLLYENNQCLAPSNQCTPSRTGYRFPGHPAYAAHAPGDVVHVPNGVASVYVKVLGAPDGDPYTGQGAITYGTAPTQILFNPPPTFGSSSFTMHYAGKVPAKGALTYRFVYSTAYTYAQVHSEALAAQRALKAGKPVVQKAGPWPEHFPASGLAEGQRPPSKHGGF